MWIYLVSLENKKTTNTWRRRASYALQVKPKPFKNISNTVSLPYGNTTCPGHSTSSPDTNSSLFFFLTDMRRNKRFYGPSIGWPVSGYIHKWLQYKQWRSRSRTSKEMSWRSWRGWMVFYVRACEVGLYHPGCTNKKSDSHAAGPWNPDSAHLRCIRSWGFFSCSLAMPLR